MPGFCYRENAIMVPVIKTKARVVVVNSQSAFSLAKVAL
jgi:hypothetical protein